MSAFDRARTMPPGVVPYIVPLRVLQGSGAIRARRVWGSWGEGDNGLYIIFDQRSRRNESGVHRAVRILGEVAYFVA